MKLPVRVLSALTLVAASSAAFSAVLVSGCAKEQSTTQTSGGADSALAVGKPAPEFSVTAHDGMKLNSAELKGKPVVVYFYPKDETPGCTKEACAFRDAFDALNKQGVVLIGVSSDTDESHKAFAEHHKLPFHLVSDGDGNLAKKFGVGTTLGFMQRQSFVIGADGNMKKIYRSVDVSVHAQQIQDDLKN
jgi:peroxiredoxin Q/BCP